MRNLDFKLMNLEKASKRLEEAVNVYDGKNDMIRDSIIQRFDIMKIWQMKLHIEFVVNIAR